MGAVLIGEVAEAAGVSAQAIRFYERQGLLRQAGRLGNGYRNYDGDTLDRLSFIQSAQTAGLTLADVRGILAMRDSAQSPCAHVQQLLADKLAEVRERKQQLTQLETALDRLIQQSTLLDPATCADSDICQIVPKRATSDA